MTITTRLTRSSTRRGNIERRPFPGNRIPASMMDPIALKALSYFPLPNTASTSITETNNWFGQGLTQSVSRQMNFKIDQTSRTRSRLTGRYSHAPSTATPPNIFGELGAAFPLNNGPNVTNTHSFVTEFTRDAESDLTMERALRPHLLGLHTGPDREFQPHQARSPSVHAGSGRLRGLPEVRT